MLRMEFLPGPAAPVDCTAAWQSRRERVEEGPAHRTEGGPPMTRTLSPRRFLIVVLVVLGVALLVAAVTARAVPPPQPPEPPALPLPILGLEVTPVAFTPPEPPGLLVKRVLPGAPAEGLLLPGDRLTRM